MKRKNFQVVEDSLLLVEIIMPILKDGSDPGIWIATFAMFSGGGGVRVETVHNFIKYLKDQHIKK